MKHFHFLGICGTAMGALASAMARRGYTVTGSDSGVYPPMSTFLEEEGIKIFSGYRPENIPAEADVIVIGNAVSRGNPEVEAVLNRKLHYMSMPEVIKENFLWGKHNYVVTGTHGKTTTTSMLTWVMTSAGLDPGFMIGGIARNLERGGYISNSDYFVLEGDEYDTAFFDKRSKFLHYLPEVVIINNIEMDHADIYADLEAVKLSFRRLLRSVPSTGRVFMNADCPNCRSVREAAATELRMVPITTVGMGEDADVRIVVTETAPSGSSFTVDGEPYRIPMVGEFNVRNAAMAVCAARTAGVEPEAIRRAFESFEGVARRQEVRGCVNSVTVVDDFAHHPTAIAQAVAGLRQRFPKSRLWCIFDPRSNTTARRIFQHELASSIATADRAVLSPIERAARIAPEERLDEDLLRSEVEDLGTPCYVGKDVGDIVDYVVSHAHPGDVLLVMSNGGFGGIHNRLLTALAQC